MTYRGQQLPSSPDQSHEARTPLHGAADEVRVHALQHTGGARTAAARGDSLRVAGALATLYLIWGSTYLGIRISLEGFPPYLMGATRFLIAGALLFVLLRARGMPLPTWRQWRDSALLGLLMLVGGMGGVAFAEQWVSSALAALEVGATPLWAALFAGLLGRWPTRLEWAGLGLGFAGLVLLNLDGQLHANLLGALVLLIAPACWAFASVLSRRLTLPPGLMGSAAEMLAGGAMLLIVSLARGERLQALPSLRPLLAISYLIVFGSLVAFSTYLYLLAKVRPAVATSYAYVNPVVALGLGVWLAGEHVGSLALLAMPAILCGVVLVLVGRSTT